MSNVIKITGTHKAEPSKRLWECVCGCQQWFVHEYGGIECCNCNEISQTIGCFEKEKDNNKSQ